MLLVAVFEKKASQDAGWYAIEKLRYKVFKCFLVVKPKFQTQFIANVVFYEYVKYGD